MPAPDGAVEIAFLALEDALAQPLCPLCRVVRGAEERYAWALLYELSLDRSVRERFDTALGFCGEHGALAGLVAAGRELVSGSRIASFYESVVLAYLERLETPGRGAARLAAGGCQLCRERDGGTRRETGALLRMLTAASYREAYRRSQGLCNPHMVGTLAAARDPERRFLLDDQRSRMRTLQERLARLQRGQNHDAGEPLTAEERESWREALWRFGGVVWDSLLVSAR